MLSRNGENDAMARSSVKRTWSAILALAAIAAAGTAMLVLHFRGRSEARDAIAAVFGASDFRMTYATGSGLRGYKLLEVDAHGNCTYLYPVRELLRDPATGTYRLLHWKQARFLIDSGQLAQLRRVVEATDFWRLSDRRNDRVKDGWHICIAVEGGGRRKAVDWVNADSAARRQIGSFIEQEILKPKQKAISESASGVEFEEASRAMREATRH